MSKLFKLAKKIQAGRTSTKLKNLHTELNIMEKSLQAQIEQQQKMQSQWQQAFHKLQQTVNLMASTRPVGAKTKVVFLVHYIESWDSLGDIYDSMRTAEDFEPLVISIKRRFPGQETYGFEEVIHEKLNALGIDHLRFSMEDSFEGLDILKSLRPDIIFRQSQWDNDVPPAFHVAELRFARLCYVPYFVGAPAQTQLIDKGQGRDFEIDSDLYRAAWKIFYPTEDQKIRFRKYSVRGTENVEIVGHPKVKRLMRIGAEVPFWPIKQEGNRRFRIIWAPHHSIDNNWFRFGLFHLVYKDMLEWVKNDNSIEMVLHFHPVMLSKLTEKGSPLSKEDCQKFLQEWDSLPNTARHSDGAYAGLMQASDCMLTDGLSFLAEYQFFNKPLIFLERTDHVPFSPAGEQIIKGVHPVVDVAEAKKLAHHFAGGNEDNKAQMQRDNTVWLAGEKLAAGTAAERILHSIRRGIREEQR